MFKKVALIAIAVLAVGTLGFAGEAQVAKGKVEAINGNSLTIATEDGESLTFQVTDKTAVVAEGASHKTAALNNAGGKTQISEFVRDGQHVTVKYWEKDGARYIKKLRVH